uniref:FYVE-type zinc finger domain-containing protein n=1 Tax=Castor canadensis TaxID=51338 RepID=A0A8C0WRP0_CASCN
MAFQEVIVQQSLRRLDQMLEDIAKTHTTHPPDLMHFSLSSPFPSSSWFLSEMKQKLDEEGSKCSILSKHQKFVEHCCMRCCSPFTFLVNTKRQCGDCKFNVCKSCCSYQKHEKLWVCCVCQQAR